MQTFRCLFFDARLPIVTGHVHSDRVLWKTGEYEVCPLFQLPMRVLPEVRISQVSLRAIVSRKGLSIERIRRPAAS